MKHKISRLGASAVGTMVILGSTIGTKVMAQVDTSYELDYGDNDLETIIEKGLNFVLGVSALAAAVVVVIGGVLYLISAGDETKIEKAKKTLSAGIIGLVIVMAAWGISLYAVNILGNFTGTAVE